MKKLILLLFVGFFYANAIAQCSIDPWSLDKRITESDLVVEAKVLNSESTWDIMNHNIYTVHNLQVYKVFKGAIQAEEIQVVTMGGTVGMESHAAHPSFEIQSGDIGIFLLSENTFPVEGDKMFMATASVQSLIAYDMTHFKARDGERIFESINFELYPYLENKCEQDLTVIKGFNPEAKEGDITPLAPPVIDSFSLDTVSSGTETVIKIYGTNFGFAQGTDSKVGFKDANYGDGRFYYPPINWSYINWSNTEIEMYVPTRAGTGVVEVVNAAGENGESTDELYVKYSHLNTLYGTSPTDTQFYLIDHLDKNGQGGYSWQMTDSFSANKPAVNSFIRSLEEWRCGTAMNWIVGKDTSLDQLASDQVNIVRFSDLGGNTLGVCWSRYTGCFNGGILYWSVREMDIEFDSTYPWYYGTNMPAFSEYDFQSVATHELGHGHQLGHVRDDSKIMHYSLTNGDRSVDLSVFDLEGGVYVRDRGTQSNVCGDDPITAVIAGECQISVPTSMFTLSDTVVCPGEDIVFTDASMGKIDAYEWLFGEGASDSIEITGGPHTISYDSGGMKTVQLVVSNDFGSDTSEYTLLVLPAQPEQPLSFIFDDTACFGLQTYTVLDNPLYSGFVWNLSSGGAFNGSTNTNSVQIDWTSAGTHQVSVVAVNACGSSEAQEDTIHILPEALAGFSYNADGTTVTFTFEGENADSIEWHFGDGNISRDSNPVYSYPDKGDYTAELKVWNECKRDSVSQSFNLQFPVGIAELKQNLSVYPNPASSGETLYFEGTQVNRLTLYSTVGATVLKQELVSNSWFIPNLEDGFYVIEVETQQGRYEMRLLICNQ